jgi:lipopolysaccharide transport protein LptA
MARSFPDTRRIAALLLTVACAGLMPARSATTVDTETPISFTGFIRNVNIHDGTMQAREIVLQQGAATQIRAAEAAVEGMSGGGYENSRWQLTGKVHIEFNNAVLDADEATVIFEAGQLKEAHAKAAPAQFSHPLKNNDGRFEGRSATIDYDSKSAEVRFAGSVQIASGCLKVTSAEFIYNLDTGDFRNVEGSDDVHKSQGSLCLDKRVPPPRTPDRATAQ